MHVIWSPSAKNTYLDIIDQIFIDWGIDKVEKFEMQVNYTIDRVKNHNHICPKSIFKDLHKCVINKHNSLIYRLRNEDTIEIVIFLFNKSDHIFNIT